MNFTRNGADDFRNQLSLSQEITKTFEILESYPIPDEYLNFRNADPKKRFGIKDYLILMSSLMDELYKERTEYFIQAHDEYVGTKSCVILPDGQKNK